MSKKVLVCGVGRMGRRHIRAAQHLGHSIVGFFDTSEVARTETFREFQLDPRTEYHDVNRMFAENKADVCIVATTTPTHAPFAIAAMKSGCRHVLIEKPVASSIDECHKVMNTAKETGSIVAVNHPYSEIGLSKFIRNTVQSNEFGGLSSCHIVGGDAGLAMNGIHFFDLFEFVAGSRIKEISARLFAQLAQNPRGPQYNDSSGIIDVSAASGARLHIDISNDHGVGRYGIFMGAGGSMRVDLLTSKYELSVRTATTRHLPSTQYDAATFNSSGDAPPIDMVELSAQALDRLISDSPIADIYDGERFLRYLVACYVSSENHGLSADPLGALPEDRKFLWA